MESSGVRRSGSPVRVQGFKVVAGFRIIEQCVPRVITEERGKVLFYIQLRFLFCKHKQIIHIDTILRQKCESDWMDIP